MAQLKDLLVTGAARILGKLYASEFVGKLTGNADSATKATKDSANQQINTTYIKGLSVSGKTITYTKGDNSTGTINTQDTNTTYSTGTTSYSGTTKLYAGTGSATDGTMTQKAITDGLNSKSGTGHTHNYAGSSSAGGVANSAAKLAAARTVSGGTDITMSFNYDGSGNSGASIGYYNCNANKGNTNHYPFHRFAKLDTIAGSYTDKVTTFLITQDYVGGGFGIVRVALRTENTGAVSSGEIKWLVRSGLAADSVQMGLYNVFGSTYADLFFKSSGTYTGTVFRAIANGNRGSVSRTWVLISSYEVNDTTSSDKKKSNEVYASIASAATALHKKAYSITVSGSDSGSTSYANSAGNSTKWNGYTLDIATANTKDTWLLVANNNMIQHKLTTDFADSKHTHDLNTMINTLTTGNAAPQDNDYYIAQYIGGGTTTTTYHRRPHSALWTYIKEKTDNIYSSKNHTHNYAGSSSAGGNANAAVKLATARSINGTNFDGSGNITTANWGTARTITVGNTGKSVNGSGNVSWSLGEIGIHVSKTVPTASDGKNGDIWIVYE